MKKTIETVKTRLLFKKIANFTGKLLQKSQIFGMRNFQDTSETRKRSSLNLYHCTLKLGD